MPHQSFNGVTKGISDYVKRNHPEFEVADIRIFGVKGGGHQARIMIKPKGE